MEENASMPEEKSMEKTSEKSMMTPGSPQKNNMPIIIGIIVILLLLVGAVAAYFLLKNDDPNLENQDDLYAYMEDVASNINGHDGPIRMTLESNGTEISYTFDFKAESATGSYPPVADEFYATPDEAFIKIGGQWYIAEPSDFGFDFDELSSNFDVSYEDTEDPDEITYVGEEDCPNIDGTCFVVNNEDEMTTIYIQKSTDRLVYAEAPGGSYMVEYLEGKIEIPNDVRDEAIEYDALTPLDSSTSTDDDEFDYDEFLDSLEEGDEDYYNSDEYQELLEELESL
jgi:hypothetical protein